MSQNKDVPLREVLTLQLFFMRIDILTVLPEMIEGMINCSIVKNTLAVQNVTVASNGNLSLSAPAQITINGPFEVKSGGILNIRQSQQMIFTYTYDASGNRTTRQFSAMASSLEAVPVDQEED